MSSSPESPIVGAPWLGADEGDEPGAVLGRVAGLDQRLDRLGAVAGEVAAREAERVRAHHLALAHRDAAEDLVEVFADADAHEEVLGLAEAALAREAAGIGRHLADRLGIGRKPGEPMRRVLLGLEPLGRDAAVGDDLRPHPPARLGNERRGVLRGGVGERDQVRHGSGGGGGGHAKLPSLCGAA